MPQLRALATALLLAALSSCVTPFAPTQFPVLEDPRFEGIWELEFQPMPDEPADANDPAESVPEAAEPLVVRFSVTRVLGKSSGQRGLSSIVDGLRPDQPTSFRVSSLYDEGDEESAERFLHGQLVQAGEYTFLTLQPDASAFADPFHLFAAPIQRTFRFERDGDVVRLWWHRRSLIWTPLPFAGDFRFHRGENDGEISTGLVQTFDDALRFYGDSREDAWTLFATAVRVD